MMMIMGERSLHLLHVFLVLFLCMKLASGFNSSRLADANIRCIKEEREALLVLKQGLVDDYGHLSSWGSEDGKKDCCNWRGIECSNRTSHVITLDLSSMSLSGKISPSLSELQYLDYFDFSFNNFGGSHIPMFIGSLTKLRYLDLSKANFGGTIPYQLGNLTNLQYLDLRRNHESINVENLEWLSRLSSLEHLDMSNVNLSKAINWLQAINMLPSLLELILDVGGLPDIVPPSLSFVNSSTSLDILYLSGNYLSSSIFHWLFNFSGSLVDVDLSDNHLQGSIPDGFHNMKSLAFLYLSSNQLDGPLPLFPSNLSTLDLSKNRFSGSISSLCAIMGGVLTFIDLSNNLLSGGLPDCWLHFPKLRVLNLANNNLFGKIPNSIGSLYQIVSLYLRNNSFFGELPLLLRHCTLLRILDLGNNKLSAKIPAWIGESLLRLFVLSLRSNEFYGNIPWNLCHLQYIQILDLSQNNISGIIPQCLNNFTAMSHKGPSEDTISLLYHSSRYGDGRTIYVVEYVDSALVVLKGLELEYTRNLRLLKSINLSANKLVGEIPGEITSLIDLLALNLSRNNLSGQITTKIGQLRALESLDLSQNQLFGEIPVSLSDLNFLGVLDLSNNNLSGKIPTGTQLQSFNDSSYSGNFDLCGPPLPNKCPGDKTAQVPPISGGREDSNIQENEDGFISPGFYVSMGLGFALGFWGVCGTLWFNNSWRYAYFRFLNYIRDGLYVIIAVNTARLQRRLAG